MNYIFFRTRILLLLAMSLVFVGIVSSSNTAVAAPKACVKLEKSYKDSSIAYLNAIAVQKTAQKRYDNWSDLVQKIKSKYDNSQLELIRAETIFTNATEVYKRDGTDESLAAMYRAQISFYAAHRSFYRWQDDYNQTKSSLYSYQLFLYGAAYTTSVRKKQYEIARKAAIAKKCRI